MDLSGEPEEQGIAGYGVINARAHEDVGAQGGEQAQAYQGRQPDCRCRAKQSLSRYVADGDDTAQRCGRRRKEEEEIQK